MIALSFLDPSDHTVQATFQSEDLSPLFSEHTFDFSVLVPAIGSEATSLWNSDATIAALQTLQEDITPRPQVDPHAIPGVKRESDLTDLDRQAIAQGGARYFTLNNATVVDINQPLAPPQTPIPQGAKDLSTLIATLLDARNRALALQVVSL